MNAYSYRELREKAKKNPTKENLSNLGEWMQQYGNHYWNGEEWDIDEGNRLRPIYNKEEDKYGEHQIISYKWI